MRFIHWTPTAPLTFLLATLAAAAAHAQVPAPSPVAASDGVMVIPGADTRAGFAKGTPLYEGAAYKIHASRRDGPGTAEIHGRDTDIFYILEGTATLVTGGRAVDPTTTAPDEVRAPRLEGGTVRQLAKGDIVVVPNGVTHWFRDVQGPFLYYTVKVTGPAVPAAGGTK
jgi:mannose-6-phosphate isomerase-like protein (cupin superfamily)